MKATGVLCVVCMALVGDRAPHGAPIFVEDTASRACFRPEANDLGLIFGGGTLKLASLRPDGGAGQELNGNYRESVKSQKDSDKNSMNSVPTETKSVSGSEAEEIKRCLLPLPHEISVGHKVVLAPGDIGIRLRKTAGPAERNTVAQLRQLFKEQAGVEATGDKFEILVGLIDNDGAIDGIKPDNAERLKEVPNNEQAYLIQPVQENRLIVGALSEKGLLYGVTTLCQLIEANITKEAVSIPLVSVLDWPDFDDRGFWHMPRPMPLQDIPWMASLKLNKFHCATNFDVLPDNKPVPQITPYFQKEPAGEKEWSIPFDEALSRGVEVIPGIVHMDFFESGSNGFTSTYPELIGKGERPKSGAFERTKYRAPCASNPRLIEILTELMTNIASWGVSTVYVWTTEYPGGQCECEACVKEGQFQAEVRSALTAWRNVRKTYPELKLGLFFGAGGFTPGEKWFPDYPKEAVDEILATLPKEVRMCVSLGIDDDVLKDYVDQGGLVTRCFIVSLSFWDYFSGEATRKRLQRLHANKVNGILQYLVGWEGGVDIKETLDFQLSVMAEYSWNINGRSIKEFAESWATRHGYKQPLVFGEWMSLMSGLVGESSSMDQFISAGSWLKELSSAITGEKKTSVCEGTNSIGDSITECRKALEWSKFFESKQLSLRAEVLARKVAFQGTNSIDDSISDCRKALELARSFESKEPLLHTEVLLRYCELEKAGDNLIESCYKRENNDIPQMEYDGFKEAMQQFIKALNAQSVSLSSRSTDSERKRCIANLEKSYKDVLKSVR